MSRDLSYLSKYQTRDASAFTVPNAGASFPRISVGNNRFTAIAEDGTETFLDVKQIEFVVIDGNPNPSKVYYDGPYDPNVSAAPTCFSENGFSPDIRVYEPQSQYCHECPKAQWGSATSNLTGKAVKACSDYKKLAIYLVHDEAEGLYQFRIPSASLGNWNKYVQELLRFPTGNEAIKVLPHTVLTRVKWSDKQNVLAFERVDFLEEDWMEVIVEHQNANEYQEWIGMDVQAQSRRQLESHALKPAPQLEKPRVVIGQVRTTPIEEAEIIDVKPEKAAPAPRKRPGNNGAPVNGPGKGPYSEPEVQAAPVVENAMERARRRAQEKIRADTGR